MVQKLGQVNKVTVAKLPEWLRNYWIPKSGLSPVDIARYITSVLLEPNGTFLGGAFQVIGRGGTSDSLTRMVTDHILRNQIAPNIYLFSGVRGIGRQTFATQYMRSALSSEANLVHGPVLLLSPQADLPDLYLALRSEITPEIKSDEALAEFAAFSGLNLEQQIHETISLMTYFGRLGQGIRIVSAGGLFEDNGQPKKWVMPLLTSIPRELFVFIISSRRIPIEIIESTKNIIQFQVEPLVDGDVKSLMILTAKRYELESFQVSAELIRAIGGHADVANAAVRLAAVKGIHILEKDPSQLFNIQTLILGDNIANDALRPTEKRILSLLSWVPSLDANLLEKTLLSLGEDQSKIVQAIENLILGCLIIASGHAFLISSAIRQVFRRQHPTPDELLKAFAKTLKDEWSTAQSQGKLRVDLVESFVFMHSLEGSALPKEFRALLTPGALFDVVKDMYAQGKEANKPEALERVIEWGGLAKSMPMSEATREEILSTVVRAQIRLGKYADAESNIKDMASKGYSSVSFLLGHLHRKQESYHQAIDFLKVALSKKKYRRSTVHELALSLKKTGRVTELSNLLSQFSEMLSDSAMFTDFQVGVFLAQGKLDLAAAAIDKLKRLPDDDNRSTIREAQLLMRRKSFEDALELLSSVGYRSSANQLRIRSLRSMCASYAEKFSIAEEDIAFVKRFPAWQAAAVRLEATLSLARGNPIEARKLLDSLHSKSAEDQILYARALEAEAVLPQTTLVRRSELTNEAALLRDKYHISLEFDFFE